jgi:hypothetical protein
MSLCSSLLPAQAITTYGAFKLTDGRDAYVADVHDYLPHIDQVVRTNVKPRFNGWAIDPSCALSLT